MAVAGPCWVSRRSCFRLNRPAPVDGDVTGLEGGVFGVTAVSPRSPRVPAGLQVPRPAETGLRVLTGPPEGRGDGDEEATSVLGTVIPARARAHPALVPDAHTPGARASPALLARFHSPHRQVAAEGGAVDIMLLLRGRSQGRGSKDSQPASRRRDEAPLCDHRPARASICRRTRASPSASR